MAGTTEAVQTRGSRKVRKGKVISKSGTWFSYGDERLGQGRENARDFLKEHSETAEEIAEKIRQAAGIVPVPMDASPEEAQGEEFDDDLDTDEE